MPEETVADNSTYAPNSPPPTEVPTEQPKTAKSKKIIIYVGLIVVLLLLLGILAYINLFTEKSQEKEPEATSSATKVEKQEEIEEVGAANETQDTKVTKVAAYCTDGSIFENTKQGYKVCLIKGWYTSEFDPSSKSVGFDSNPIPEASEYGGLIVVNTSNQTASEISAQTADSLDGETSTNVTIDGVSGTQISGTIPADNVYYPDYKEVVTIVSKFNRTYEVTMITSPDKFAANQATYNDFLAGWHFLGMAESPP
jgi:hypothetical protein